MILIDKPYVSDFLKETLENSQIEVVKTKIASEILQGRNINFISEEVAIEKVKKEEKQTPVYTNSENAIDWVEKNLSFSSLPTKNKLFKNKIRFRELIKPLFPDYFFKAVAFADLDNLDIKNLKYPFIIKPAVGFFSFGVHKVEKPEKWASVLPKIKKDITIQKGIYPEVVLNTSNFIIEECIKGDEFAIDCYFDKEGKIVILNILHHLFSSGNDVNDRVYISSKEIIEKHKLGLESFMQKIGDLAELSNYPVHVEVRINENGKISPIEINPMRFGGWCTTADLTWFAYGFNSYEYYQKQQKPDWNTIFKGKENTDFSLIVLDNSTGTKIEDIKSFNYDKLMKNFNKPIHLRKVDFKKYLVFGFLFVETPKDDKTELENILHSNLSEFVSL